MDTRALAALASVAFFAGGAAVAPAQTAAPATSAPAVKTMVPMPAPTGPGAMRTMPAPAAAPLALDARSLRGMRTAAGYRLTGQALVNDPCQAAKFAQFFGNIFPPQFNLVQYRRPDKMGMLCIQRLTWVSAQLNVASAAPPRYVTVRTQKGITRVPIPPGPAN